MNRLFTATAAIQQGAVHGQFAVSVARNRKLAMVFVDRPQRAFETTQLQIAQHDGAQAAGALGNANHGHRGGRKQGFEVANAHVNPC
jgi:hypothetical protein